MSDAAQAFSKNYELTSLGAGVGCTVGVRCCGQAWMSRDSRPPPPCHALSQAFKVTRWVPDGFRLSLDDANPSLSNTLEMVHTPGHTPDSMCILDYGGRRLYVGDMICACTRAVEGLQDGDWY